MFKSNIDLVKILIICNVLALLASCFVIIFFNRNKKKENWNPPVSNSMVLLMSCYVASVAAFTIVPLPYSELHHDLRESINFEPIVNSVRTLLDTSRGKNRLLAMDALQNITGNILLFVPLGILLPIANHKFASYKRIFAIAACCSISIELTQLFSRLIHNYRQVDIDDVIFNTIGAILGYFLYERWNHNHKMRAIKEVLQRG